MKENLTTYRYIRVIPEYEVYYNEAWNDNLYGITIRFDIDFVKREVTARWAVCDGDNFSKEVGRSYADYAYTAVTFLYDMVDDCEGLTNALIAVLSGTHPKYGYDYDKSWSTPMRKKIDLFKRALREI